MSLQVRSHEFQQKPTFVEPTEDLAESEPPRLLAVSFSYPPQTEPRAIQVSRLLQHTRASTVLVCEGSPDTKADAVESFGLDTRKTKTVRVPLPKSSWRRLVERLASRVYLPVWSMTPDHLGPWRQPVVKTIEDLLSTNDYRPDVLVTFSFPLVDSLIGLELKQRFQLPWLAHFSDPWVDSPFRKVDRFTRMLNARLERSVMEAADRLVFTSPETAELVMHKYPLTIREKVRIVPHAYEGNLFPQPADEHGDRMIIRYLGDLYLDRTPKPLFQALEILLSSDPELLKEFCFEIVGEVHDMDLEQMGLSRLPEGLVAFRGRVGYQESLALMTSAAGLMVIDAPVAKNMKSVFLPSKLIEYVGAARPIIGLTPSGTASDLIERLGGWVVDPGETQQVAKVVRQFLYFLREQRREARQKWGRPDVREEFEAGNVALKFEQVLRELYGNSRTRRA
jgi:glycosyltransferase involved in cell wall biosynthesis